MSKQYRAAALISGGLDSMLATKVILEQGIDVQGINFYTGFCVEGHTHAIRKKDQKKQKRNNALWTAEQLGIKLHILDVSEDYKGVLTNPQHGYGANINPCLDCKIFMVKKALEWITQNNFDFIITGEVVGQRPMSQRKDTMPVIARESGVNDLLLRPLSAKNLPATKPELEGWVDRDLLHGFSGRSRKPQIALAQSFGIDDYAQPAGGCCFLTDANYALKLNDLWKARGSKNYDLDDIMLLKIGRHFRPRPHFKLLIAREEGEVRFLEGYRKRYAYLNTTSHHGPIALIDGTPTADELVLAASLVARYSQGRDAERVTLEHCQPGGDCEKLEVTPLRSEDIPKDWII